MSLLTEIQFGHCDDPHAWAYSKTGNKVPDTVGNVDEALLSVCRVVGIYYDIRILDGVWIVKFRFWHEKERKYINIIRNDKLATRTGQIKDAIADCWRALNMDITNQYDVLC